MITSRTPRRRRRLTRLFAAAGLAAAAFAGQVTPASAEVFDSGFFGSAEFPLGLQSFADEVVSYTPVGDVEDAACCNNPAVALGWQTLQNVSLGDNGQVGGELIVRFTDNVLVDQNLVEGGADLYIFEAGAQVEAFTVSVSTDGQTWLTFPTPVSGRPSAVDLDDLPGHVPGTAYSYVKINEVVDGSSCCGQGFSGADIMAIGAIGAEAVETPVGALVPVLTLGGGMLLGVVTFGAGRQVLRNRREVIAA